jgi:hypothetical protein
VKGLKTQRTKSKGEIIMNFRNFYIPTVMAGLAILTSANHALAIGKGQYSGYQNNTQGKSDNATLSIEKTYNCTEGACFKGYDNVSK